MFRLAQRSKLLAASGRLFAASKGAERELSSSVPVATKAVIFNLGGAVVPSMFPVIQLYTQKNHIPPNFEDTKNKLLVENDADTWAALTSLIGAREASQAENTGDLYEAIVSMKAEGFSAILLDDPREYNSIPVDVSVFNAVVPLEKFSADFVETFAQGINNVDRSDIVYVDNCEENLARAVSYGCSTVKVGDYDHRAPNFIEALTALENKLQVPLKTFVPGVNFNWFDYKNNDPNKKGKFIYLCICVNILMIAYQTTVYYGLSGGYLGDGKPDSEPLGH